MAVYYKFKSTKDYESISIDGHFITVSYLKEKIYEIKQLHRGTDYDLIVTNSQTNEEYHDEEMLIPKNTSVLLRRIPGPPRMPLVAAPVTEQTELKMVNEPESGAGLSVTNYVDFAEYDDFGDDLYEIPEVVPVTFKSQPNDSPASIKDDEDNKIQALIDTSALDWQQKSFGAGRGFGHAMGGQIDARSLGRGGGFERKIPPTGYVCHRCKTPGHYIQHCPTNGDPNFDIKRVKPPTGIPKSMLMATSDNGSYALSNGAVAVLKPNEAAFEKEIEGIPSTSTVGDIPPELHCQLCKQVMKFAVFTSKCCFMSFCDKCIRDQIIEKSACVCGATNVLADDLLPNKTVRDAINRILESNSSSAENGGSVYHVQDMVSAICEPPPPPPKIPSPTSSATATGDQPPPQDGDIINMQACPTEHDVTPVGDEVQQKQAPTEPVMKKKRKRVNTPISAAEMQWNYMMPPGSTPYNHYWTGMQPGIHASMGPYGYGLGPMDFMFPQDPFGGPMMSPSIPYQRDLVTSQDEFESRRADLKRKRNFETRGGTESFEELPKERDSSRQARGDGHRHRTERQSPDHHHRKSHRQSESSSASRRHRASTSSDSKPVAAADATATSAASDPKHNRHIKRRRSRYELSPARDRDQGWD